MSLLPSGINRDEVTAEVEQIREVMKTVEFGPTATASASDFGEDDIVLFDGDASLSCTADLHVESDAPDIDTLIPPPEDV